MWGSVHLVWGNRIFRLKAINGSRSLNGLHLSDADADKRRSKLSLVPAEARKVGR